MASIPAPIPQMHALPHGPLAMAGGIVATILLGTTHAFQTYAGVWMVGAPAILFVLLAGTAVERTVLILLSLLALLLGGEMMRLGFRQVIFIATFMLFARYLVVPPLLALSAFLAGAALYIRNQGEYSALYALAPTMVLLLLASEIRHRARVEDRPLHASDHAKTALLAGLALVFPLLGSGSRAALFVWGAYVLRQLSLPLLLVSAVAVAVVLQMPDITVIEKLKGSLSELTTPIPEDGVGFSMRALEGLVFLSWLETATLGEILFGANEIIYLPGAFLGRDPDPPFIPHNQLFGLLFQFGVTGLVALGWYLTSVWRHMAPFPAGRYLFFVLLIPGFITGAGFITADYAVIAGVINAIMLRSAARPAA